MKPEEYRDLYNRLKDYDDIKRVHEETGLDEELLLVIYTQRVSRDVTRNFYKVKACTKKMVQDWNRKQSFMEIARRWYFSPILAAYFIMTEKGCKRKEFWAYVRDPDKAPDKRLQREFREIAERDMVYSLKGMEIQYARGRWGEAKLAEWLKYKGLTHRTEKDLRGKSAKTPDCLLDRPFEWNGIKINWIESKASFADDIEFRKNARKQLNPYTEMFGTGIVVYWFGFTTNLQPPDGVFIADGRFFELPMTEGPDPMTQADVIKPAALAGDGSWKPSLHLPKTGVQPPLQPTYRPSLMRPHLQYSPQKLQSSQQPQTQLQRDKSYEQQYNSHVKQQPQPLQWDRGQSRPRNIPQIPPQTGFKPHQNQPHRRKRHRRRHREGSGGGFTRD